MRCVEGTGLTVFKKAGKYLICAILLGALAYLCRERERLERSVFFEEKGIRIGRSEDLGRVVADPKHLYQIFSNLIADSIACNDGGACFEFALRDYAPPA